MANAATLHCGGPNSSTSLRGCRATAAPAACSCRMPNGSAKCRSTAPASCLTTTRQPCCRRAEIPLPDVKCFKVNGQLGHEIGRASCRARVCKYESLQVVAGILKKKHRYERVTNV